MVRATKEMSKNGQDKLKLVLKKFGRACSINKIHDGFTHHVIVTHCPATCPFHIHKVTGNCLIDFTVFFITKDYVCWCPKEVQSLLRYFLSHLHVITHTQHWVFIMWDRETSMERDQNTALFYRCPDLLSGEKLYFPLLLFSRPNKNIESSENKFQSYSRRVKMCEEMQAWVLPCWHFTKVP